MDFALRGKVAVVTGGSEGIGFAIAEGLAAEGVNVVLCARDEEKVQAAARTITEKYSVAGARGQDGCQQGRRYQAPGKDS